MASANPGARNGPLWTKNEDATLRRLFGKMTAAEISARLPGRNESAVFHRTRRIGLVKNRRWTNIDDQRLRTWWGEPIRKVARELGRSVITVYWRAQVLGLPLGVPQGGEYLTAAAKRCGYAIKTFRKILRWAGVKVRRSVTRNPRECWRGTHWVDPDDASDAVARWCRTETPQAAGRRYNTDGETIVRRLVASGLPLPPKPRFKRHWRIESELIDQACAMVEKRGRHLVVVRRAA